LKKQARTQADVASRAATYGRDRQRSRAAA
jgi:hypothetical protein